MESGYEDQLFGPEAPNWTELSGDERAELVKGNRRRKVWRVQLDGLSVFVKRYEAGGIVRRGKHMFRSSPAAAEFENHRLVSGAGLGCPKGLAFGQKGPRGMGGASILITAAVSPAEPLDLYLNEHGLHDELVSLLAEFLGRTHRSGLAHPDPHMGNFLVGVDSAGERALFLTDLQKLYRLRLASENENRSHRMSGGANEPADGLTVAAKRNVAKCYGAVSYFMSGRQKEQFLDDYLAVVAADRIPPEATVRELLSEIEGIAWKASLHRWAKRDQQCRRSNKYFSRIRLPGHWKGSVVLARRQPLGGSVASASHFTAEQWREALANPLDLFSGPEVEKIKDSGSSLVVRRRLEVGGISLEVYCKLARLRPEAVSRLKTVWGSFRASRPQRAYERGFALLNRRIPAVLPLAWLAKQIGLYRRFAVLITEAMPETVDLEEFLKTKLDSGEDSQSNYVLKDLAKMTAELAGSLIRHGFIHGDFQPRNILLQQVDGRRRLVLTDLDAIGHIESVTSRERLRLPMRMHLATKDWASIRRTVRLRFLLRYLRRIHVPKDQWKWYWRKAYSWTDRKKPGE